MLLFSLKDNLAGFQNPFVAPSKQVALRQLSLTVNAKEPNSIQAVMSDIDLYQVGTFDYDTGELKPSLEFICHAVDCLSGGDLDGSK